MATSAIMRREIADDRLFTTGVIAGLAAAAAIVHTFTPLNHDVAYFVALAGRLLDGGSFGREIMDMNPPHVWWISAVPVWIARHVGLRIDAVAAVFTALMAALSVIAVERLVNFERFARNVFLPLVACLVLFAPGYDFGQREHWMLLLTLPYVVACACRLNGTQLPSASGAAIGTAACLGFCIKPYLLLVPVACEIWILARTRRPSLLLRPETTAMAVTGLVYAGLIVVYARSYLEIEVPTALLGYWTYKSPMLDVLITAIVLLAPTAMLLLIVHRSRRQNDRIPALAKVCAVAGAASLVAALIQMKPWSYHFLPGIVFFAIAAVALLVAGRSCTDRRSLRRIAFAMIVTMAVVPTGFELARAMAAVPTGFELTRAFEADSGRVNQLAAVFRSNPGPNRTVFGFTTSLRDVFPAVIAAQVEWAAPFCCEYLIAAAVRADDAPAADRAKIKAAGLNQAEIAIAAVRIKQPGVIVVATGDDMLGFNGRRFDYLEWLEAHTDFARVLLQYREISPIGPFRVLVRKQSPV